MMSVYPSTALEDIPITATYIAERIRLGHKNHSTGYPPLPVLSADEALAAVPYSAPGDDYPRIQFVSPPEDSSVRLAGTVQLTVALSGPGDLYGVGFYLYPDESNPGDPGGGYRFVGFVSADKVTQAGHASFLWDTTKVDDGSYSLEAYWLDADGEILAGTDVRVVIANDQDTGLIIRVVDPDGDAASGAWVTVHHAYISEDEGELELEEVWHGQADASGRVLIPNSKATGGNEYLVVARGVDPSFLYYKVVKAPNPNVLLDSAGAETVTVSGKMTDGETPLATATVLVEMLQSNLPMMGDSDAVLGFNLSGSDMDRDSNTYPMLVLNAQGTGAITLTHGKYNLRLISSSPKYYLVKRGQEITGSTGEVAFHPSPQDVATLVFAPDDEWDTASLILSIPDDEYADGFEHLQPGESVVVCPGVYEAEINEAVHRDEDAYEWSFTVPPFSAVGGGTVEVRCGGRLNATLEPEEAYEEYRKGQDYSFIMEFADSYGNVVSSVFSDYVASRYPYLEVYHSGTADLAADPELSYNWSDITWYIPSGADSVPPGYYDVVVKVNGGPLGDPAKGGWVVSDAVQIEVKGPADPPPEEEPDLTLTVTSESIPLEQLDFYLAALYEGAYMLYQLPTTYGEGGLVELYSLDNYGVEAGDTVTLVMHGDLDSDAPVFATAKVYLVQMPAVAEIDVGPLRRVNLRAIGLPRDTNADGKIDEYDQPTILTKAAFSIYEVDSEIDPAGIPLGIDFEETWYGGTMSFLVPTGEYLFEARVQWPFQSPTLYYLSKQVTVDASGDEDPSLEVDIKADDDIDANDAVQFSMQVPSPALGYKQGDIILLRSGHSRAWVFWTRYDSGVCAPLYVTPGTYHVTGMLTRDHFDGEWSYALVRSEAADVQGGSPYVWTIGVPYATSQVVTDKSLYERDEVVAIGSAIGDGQGNRLIGLLVDPEGGFEEWSVAKAETYWMGRPFTVPEGQGGGAGAQTHMDLGPFITVVSPSGAEVFHYEGFDPVRCLIPGDAEAGEYTVTVELEAGPQSSDTVSASTTFTVGDGVPVPQLMPELSLTNSHTVTLEGRSVPGAEVTVYYTMEGPGPSEPVVAGVVPPSEIDEHGDFSLDVDLDALDSGEGVYLFTARAERDGEFSEFSPTATVTVDWTPPDPPTWQGEVGLGWKSEVEGIIELDWDAPDGEVPARYLVKRDGNLVGETTGDTTEYIDSSLQPLTSYEYQVIAVDEAGNESLPAEVTATASAAADEEPPDAPENVTAAYVPGGKARVTWDAAYDYVGVAEYCVYRATDEDGDGVEEDTAFQEVGTVPAGDPATASYEFLDTGLLAETSYLYRVVAVDAAQNSSEPGTCSLTTAKPQISSATWFSVPALVPGNLLMPESTLDLRVYGEAGRHGRAWVQYETWFDESGNRLTGPQVWVHTVELNESDTMPGLYVGMLPLSGLPHEPSSIVSVTGFVHDGLGMSRISIELKTRQLDSPFWQELTHWTWRDLVHYHVTVTGPSGLQSTPYTHPLEISSRPGDSVTVTLDGREAGLPMQTVQVTLDDTRSATARFELEEVCRIQGTVKGYDPQGSWLETRFYRKLPPGSLVYGEGEISMSGNNLRVNPAVAGDYQIEILERVPDPWGNWQYGTKAVITVEDLEVGEIRDVGEIRLGGPAPLLAGAVTATPEDATPGSSLTVRAEFGLAPMTAPSTAVGAALIIEVPPGTTLVGDTLTIDGQHVPAESVESIDGGVRVALGDLALASGNKWVANYRLRIDEEIEAKALILKASIERGPEGQRVTDTLIQDVVPLMGVTLNAPSRLSSLDPELWGRAPKGATVLVYDGDILLGQSPVSAGGFWCLKANLPDLGKQSIHLLRARVDLDSRSIFSNIVTSIYDPDQPELLSISMQQQDSNVVTVDATKSVPRFPYVIVPGQPFYFVLTFNEPDRVRDVIVQMSNQKVSAVKRADGTYFASIPYPWDYQIADKDVYVSYGVKPAIEDFKGPVPTEEQLRHMVPVSLRDFVFIDRTPPISGQSIGETGSAFVTFQPRAYAEEENSLTVRVDMTITRDITPPDFVPTAADIQRAEETGVPVYGFRMWDNMTAHTWTIEFEGYIPQDLITPDDTGGQSVHAAAGLNVALKFGGKVTITSEQAFNAMDWGDALIDGFGVPGLLDKIGALTEWAATHCSGGAPSYYRIKCDYLANQVMAGEATRAGMMLAGVLLGPETFGVGTLVIWGISEAVEWVIDRDIEENIRNLAAEMGNDDACDHDVDNDGDYDGPDDDYDDPDDDGDDPTPPGPRRRRRRKVFTPVPIWDPSGYVYEGVTSNRLVDVTATVMEMDALGGTWHVWDAEWFGQQNPQKTNVEGRYGWDVPDGTWHVVYEKAGYETAQSADLEVPPPRTDVNVGMVSLDAPEVHDIVAAPDRSSVEIEFTKYMLTSSFTDATIAVFEVQTEMPDGPVLSDPLEGTVEAVNPILEGGVSYARKARFVPATPFEVGGRYHVWVGSGVLSYSGRPMFGNVTEEFVLDGVLPEVSNVQVTAGNAKLIITWVDPTSPGFERTLVYWRPQQNATAAYSGPVEVDPADAGEDGVQQYILSGLTNGVTYEVKIATRWSSGAESAGLVVTGRPSGAGGDGGGDGYPGDGDSGGVSPQTPPKVRYLVGPAPGALELADGWVTVDYGQGAFGIGSALTFSKILESISSPPGLHPVTPVYEFELTGPKLGQRVSVTFQYDPEKLGNINPLTLGVYRQDEHDPNKWVYVGGVVDVRGNFITVELGAFSRYAVMAKQVEYDDTVGHWAAQEVQVLSARNLVQGVGDGLFEPDRSVTRAEMAKMLVLMMMQDPDNDIAFEVPQTPTFVDVAAGTWYYPYVETAAAHGVVKGENGLFRPNDPVTRQEMAAMVVRAMGLEDKASILSQRKPDFDDADEAGTWAYGYLGLALFKGLIRGVTETRLDPAGSTTRAQAAVVILRAMERLELISTVEKVAGMLRLSEVEGLHFELDTVVDGKPLTYVLMPDGGMDGAIGKRMANQVGKHVDLKVIWESDTSIYMSGPVLRVITVLLPGCVLCDP